MPALREDQLAQVLRRAWRDAPHTVIDGLCPELAATMARYDIVTVVRQKHFLAQVGHESGQGRWREELASGKQYEGRRDLGNTQPGDGPNYKGHGLIQCTGRANHTLYNQTELPRQMGLDVVENPRLIASVTALCCDVAGWFWQCHDLNAIADDPDISEEETCRRITRIINGGYNGFPTRLGLTRLAKAALASLP